MKILIRKIGTGSQNCSRHTYLTNSYTIQIINCRFRQASAAESAFRKIQENSQLYTQIWTLPVLFYKTRNLIPSHKCFENKWEKSLLSIVISFQLKKYIQIIYCPLKTMFMLWNTWNVKFHFSNFRFRCANVDGSKILE